MRNKIFRNTFLVAAIVLLCSLTVILGCMYDYFGGVQENQLRDELSLAAVGVENSGLNYLAAFAPTATVSRGSPPTARC